MFRKEKIFVQLTKLSKLTVSSNGIFSSVVRITTSAFYNKKPLFTNEEKPAAAKLMEKSLPVINQGFVYFCIGMIPDRRQEAQYMRSGLQYLIEEFKNDPKTFDKLKPIFDAPGIKNLENSIESHTGLPHDYYEDDEIDLTKIPSSHFWWFFVDEEDDPESMLLNYLNFQISI